MNETSLKIKDLICGLSNELTFIFNKPLDEAFLIAILIYRGKNLPVFKDINDEDLDTIKTFFDTFKKIKYTALEMRRGFNEAYLSCLREVENLTVNSTLELPLQFLNMISLEILKHSTYSNTNVLNAYGNNGNLASLLRSNLSNDFSIYVTCDNEKELIISETLRDLCGYDYPVQTLLPALNFRCDLIVSDPFLRMPEDILIFFEDYAEYLNQKGFFITTLPTPFIRDRAFSDLIEKHSLVLIGLIEYPKDMLEGIMESSIVILERKDNLNKEFFHAEMTSIKDVNGNLKVLEDVKNYIQQYLGDR